MKTEDFDKKIEQRQKLLEKEKAKIHPDILLTDEERNRIQKRIRWYGYYLKSAEEDKQLYIHRNQKANNEITERTAGHAE